MKIKRMMLYAAAGAAVNYFMDPERGVERRAAAKARLDQVKAQAMPKVQELRRYVTHDSSGEIDLRADESSYANGKGITVSK